MPPIDYVFAGHCPEFERMGQPVATHEVAKDCKKCLELWQLPTDPPPAQDAARDGRRPAAARKRHRRSLIAIAACWQHIGFDACDGEHEAKYDTLLCSDIFDWLGIDRAKPTSHGTRRPACMVGAVAAYLDRHPNNRPLVHRWCFEYQKICGTKGEGITYVCTVGLYDRIARKDSTKGKEKTRVFFNTYMSLKAYCNGHPTPAFSDPPEPLKDLVDPTKA